MRRTVTGVATVEIVAVALARLGPSRLYQFVPAVQASNYNMFFHSDAETPATVPAPGLAATTRAYAKIIDEVNRMELRDLQLPSPSPTTAH